MHDRSYLSLKYTQKIIYVSQVTFDIDLPQKCAQRIIYALEIFFGLYLPCNYASRIIFALEIYKNGHIHPKTCIKCHICLLSMDKKSCLTINILY